MPAQLPAAVGLLAEGLMPVWLQLQQAALLGVQHQLVWLLRLQLV